MRLLSLLCVGICLALSGAASARGGMGSHGSMAAPGTNSLGTALPSSDGGGRTTKGPLLGTSPATDKDDARLEKMLEGSICRGC